MPHRAHCIPGSIDTVDVLSIPPGRGYVEVGTLAITQPVYVEHDAVVVALRQEAARHGCDAFIVHKTRTGDTAPCLVYTEPKK